MIECKYQGFADFLCYTYDHFKNSLKAFLTLD